MEINRNLIIGRLYCLIEGRFHEIFFSLVDYRNSYFTSNNSDKIIEFYEGFENRNQLILWMTERPKGVANIYEVNGKRDIIVVIPTADFNGSYANECRENIYKGLHIIFVESGGKLDFYFNIAHNINVGLKKAIEYDPQWIIFSGDDMKKIDKIEKIERELQNIDNKTIDSVFTNPSPYHSTPMFIGKPTKLLNVSLWLLRFTSKKYSKIYQTFFHLKRFNDLLFFPRFQYDCSLFALILNIIFFKRIKSFINTLSFGIFSSNYVNRNEGKIFDETYINEMEDTDLSIRIENSKTNTTTINFLIGEYMGSTLGNGGNRTLRVVPGYSYFSKKVEDAKIKF